MLVALFEIAGFATVLLTSAALAQAPLPTNCQPIACRATYSFGDCSSAIVNDPPSGYIGMHGTVLGFERAERPCWFTRLFVHVTQASESGIPDRIYIDIRACLAWFGKIGDSISGLVARQELYPNTFSARICRPKKNG